MAFEGCIGLTSLSIPNSVTSIGMYAFRDCSGLTSVTIPNSVTSIGDGAFEGYSGLTPLFTDKFFIYLPKSYEGSYAISQGIQTIVGSTFSGCSSLTSVIIPNSVTYIGGNAFQNCSGLTSLTIPNSVTSIGNSAFDGCSGLTSLTIPNSVTSIGSSAFWGCSGLTSLTIPNRVTSIGDNAFRSCSGLTSVTIPNSVRSIAVSAFRDCEKIQIVNWNANINNFPFSPNTLQELYIGDDVTVLYSIQGYTNLRKVVLGNKVSQLRAEVFKGDGIKEFYITGDALPTCYSNVFMDVDLSGATLYAPKSLVSTCQTSAPWNGFGTILDLEGNEPERPEDKNCAAPTISFKDGGLTIESTTPGAKCYYTVSSADFVNNMLVAGTLSFDHTYTITAYAVAEGYSQSENVTYTVSANDINGDGAVNVGDVTSLAKKILEAK